MNESCFFRLASDFFARLWIVPATSIACLSVQAKEPLYLEHVWESRAGGLNLIRLPGGLSVAVADDGRHLVDSSILPLGDWGFRFETLQRFPDGFHVARDVGSRGFDWFRLGDGESFLTADDLAAAVDAPVFNTVRFLPDPDPVRGDLGVAHFPDAGIALVCGREYPSDSRISGLFPSAAGGNPGSFGGADDVRLPMQTPFVSSVRAEDLPDRVVLNEDGLGFWYLGTMLSGGPNHLALGHARPTTKANGGRDVNLTQIISVSDDATRELFETAALSDGQLLMVLAREDREIGGIAAQRRLMRVDPEGGIMAEVTVDFAHYTAELRAAATKDVMVLHSPDELVLFDAEALQIIWRKKVMDILTEKHEGYRIARVALDGAGEQLGVAFETAYRREGEANVVVGLSMDGGKLWSADLKPAPVDLLRYSDLSGWILHTSRYTAVLGGEGEIRERERAAVSRSNRLIETNDSNNDSSMDSVFVEVADEDRHRMWFDHPAPGYGRQSLPIGNGHLGGMLTGGVEAESVTFNVDSHWQGDDRDMGQYQGFGVVSVALGHDPGEVTNYRRELDLRTGLYAVTYEYGGVRYRREAFASYPHGVIGMRFTADRAGALSGEIELQAMHFADFSKDAGGIRFEGRLPNGRIFRADLRVVATGGVVDSGRSEGGMRTLALPRRIANMPYDSLVVEGSDELVLYLAADTDFAMDPGNDFFGDAPEVKIGPRLAEAGRLSFDEIRDASAADVAALFDRCRLVVATPNPEAELLPIDRRRAAYRAGGADPGLEVLAFDAVRHMMIASSRPGSLPANLQGIWNDSNWPAWTSDYHADINLQMAYWFVDPANLGECNEPLFDYIESQIPFRRRAAREVFGEHVRGWTVDYMNGIFGAGGYKNYPPGSAWYAWHFADHAKFSQDLDFLETRAYPVMKELSEHWQDLLIERPDGTLATPRTISPEHKPMQFGIGHDVQLVHSLFTDFMAASMRLGRDEVFRAEVEDLRERLIPMRIGRWGQLQEWEGDRDSRYCVHRHINHMVAAFPGNQITPDAVPELADAVITGLEARGIGGTGWSKAWRMPIFARLREPDLFERQMRAALRDFHDHLIWESYSQIDAPAGYAAGLCEALLQSHVVMGDDDSRFVLHLLPALPPSWRHGRVSGLRARGGYEVDIEWSDGGLREARIRNVASPAGEVVMRVGDELMTVAIEPGGEFVFRVP